MGDSIRNLVVVLGDQLDRDALVLRENFDREQDAVWMAEVAGEARHVPSHKARIALFLSAMRHFRDTLRDAGFRVYYRELADSAEYDDRGGADESLGAALEESLRRLRPDRIRMTAPGEWRLLREMQTRSAAAGLPLDVLPDTHFFDLVRDFKQYAEGRKSLVLEYYYRDLRKRTAYLMEPDGKPLGGRWNYDSENRESFGKNERPELARPIAFAPDEITRTVLAMVERRFGNHPGSLGEFDWPVDRPQALQALDDFIQKRLPDFGRYQDALVSGEPYLYHSRLSAALNLKLLNPREVCAAAIAAHARGAAPLNSVEGFVRQILGWREFVRGIYWTQMPEYAERNALDAHEALPEFYWDGETEMNCLRETIQQTMRFGYAHHIQRLMITGLFALLLGVEPARVHEWYLAVYVDAVEWVEMPNTLGMSQFADGGVMATKPYAASGKYIQRMSDYCASCRFKPAEATGPDACPYTTLYWDFLARNRGVLRKNPRMSLQVKNLERKLPAELKAIHLQAVKIKKNPGSIGV
ncbi:MAG: cryptochrome/photolyase family protein [bacterium]|nr:cryptochrome/photolyase family protein [bacterium]